MRMDIEYRLIAAQELREPRAFREALGYWPTTGAEGLDAELARHSPGRRMLSHAVACGALAVVLLLAMAGSSLGQSAKPEPSPISAEFPYESRFVDVLGARMHYIEQGAGDPILFLHGNPTSSYLWRNVIPFVAPMGRVIAVDNIGFGKSDKPDLDYTFQTHAHYIDGFIEALDLRNLTLVVHDWGSALGLYYATRNEANVKAVAFMEAVIPPAFPMKSYADFGPMEETFRAFRTPGQGEQIVIDENMFIEQLLPGLVVRQLSAAEMDAYRAPFLDPKSRLPILVWPREIPVAGEPARNVAVVEAIGAWLASTPTPKLLQYASPGAIISPETAAWVAANVPNVETQYIGRGLHFFQEDNPEAIGRGIADWYRRLPN